MHTHKNLAITKEMSPPLLCNQGESQVLGPTVCNPRKILSKTIDKRKYCSFKFNALPFGNHKAEFLPHQ